MTPAATPMAAIPHEARVAWAAIPELAAVEADPEAAAPVPDAAAAEDVMDEWSWSSPSVSEPPEAVSLALRAAPSRGRVSMPVLFLQLLLYCSVERGVEVNVMSAH